MISILIIILGFAIRIFNIANPKNYVFDEVYYVKDAKSLITNGVESGFFVHPELGKWLISLPMRIGGLDNTWYWRLSAAIFGTICIGLIILAVWKLLGSLILANLAGFLLAIDGVGIVMSRVALLDIFLTTFILAAFVALLYNKPSWVGIFCGLALGVKWSGGVFLILFAIYYFTKQILFYIKQKTFIQHLKTSNFWHRIVDFTLLPAFVYLITWTPYLLYRPEIQNLNIWQRLTNLAQFHQKIYNFHINLNTGHNYQSAAWQWPLMLRPTAMYYNQSQPTATNGHTSVVEIISLGNIFIWWLGLVCILYLILNLIFPRLNKNLNTKTIILCLIGITAGIGPWLIFTNRVIFQFYSIIILPFIIICLVTTIYSVLTKPFNEFYNLDNQPVNQACFDNNLFKNKNYFLKIFVPIVSIAIIASLISIYFYPVWVGLEIDYQKWLKILFLKTWI
ncbi:MAG: phospholipid carrier-dependent glycosyltransferase [Bifidobacteriaceae bacterium]|nr:phospholipid carrier-dependent glycosyltransferase [Bifidobacteriaceae bacterium]